MTAFDKAWWLLKMPIVPNSLKQREGGYTGQFYDPVDDENTPLYVHGDFDEEGIVGSIPKSARTEVTPLHSDTWMADDTETDPYYQRRGYMTALYDALAAVLNERGAKLYPNPIQSEEGEALWGDKETWPVRDDIFETGEPMDIAWRLLKGFEDWESEGDPFETPPDNKPPVNPSEELANEMGLEYPIVHISLDFDGYLIGYQCGDVWTTGGMFGGAKGNAPFINEVGQKHLQRCESCQSALHTPKTLNISHRQRRNYE